MSFGISGQASSEKSQSNSTDILSQLFQQLTGTTNTGTSTSTTSQTGGTTGTSAGSRAKTLTPYQEQVQPQLFKIMQALATDPKSFTAPAQNGAREEVNGNYSGVSDALRQQFMSNAGGGASGKYGKAAVMSDLSRRSDLSKVDNSFAQTNAQLPITAAQLMQQFLGMDFGETSTGQQQGTTAATGTNVGTTADVGTVDTTGSSSSDRNITQTGSSSSKGVSGKVGF